MQVTSEQKRMSEYAKCSIFDLNLLPLPIYLLIKRDSWIDSMNSTESGREALKDFWRLSQTKPDLKKIRERGLRNECRNYRTTSDFNRDHCKIG